MYFLKINLIKAIIEFVVNKLKTMEKIEEN